MNERVYTIILLFLSTTVTGHSIVKPNIVFILADDLGWSDIGYSNPLVKTPMLDTLAKEGVIFNQSYVTPLCTPTRAALMTGYFPFRIGFQHGVLLKNQPAGLPLDTPTIAESLKQQGYMTYMVGKWHLGFCKYEYTPNGRGFDHFYGFYNAAEDYFTHTKGPNGYLDLREDLIPDWSNDGVYSSKLFGRKAAKYIEKHDKTLPMFLYLAFQSVHGPLQVPEKYIRMYKNVTDKNRRTKLGMITAMDDAIHRVVDALKANDLWSTTLLVFSTDNGGPQNSEQAGNNWPLRGSKSSLWEGGTRGVSFAHGTMLNNTGYVNNEIIHVVDWHPTLLHVAGGQADGDMDGLNLWNTVSSGESSPRTEFVYNIDETEPSNQAIRIGDYKLIQGRLGGSGRWWVPPPEKDLDIDIEVEEIEGNPFLLFNIRDDPTEEHNLADIMPEKVTEMKARLVELGKRLVPSIDPKPVRKESSPRHFGGVFSPGWC
ncbi:arylsulfatase B-like [Glandiceps talaboti]